MKRERKREREEKEDEFTWREKKGGKNREGNEKLQRGDKEKETGDKRMINGNIGRLWEKKKSIILTIDKLRYGGQIYEKESPYF